jgi:2-keto-4-pentenoate hydratase/2-oxohepta-3-ene-1,7-dioic acid hydratase in catechol pathway
MKLATFTRDGLTAVGKVLDDQIVDISVACPDLPKDMRGILTVGDAALARIRSVNKLPEATYPLTDVKLEAPVPNASKFLAIGMNYKDHAEEAIRKGVKIPDSQVWFNKQVSCIAGPYDPTHMPRVSTQLDYEVELGVIIGKRCRHVSLANAKSVIAGYTVMNDVSVRDWQFKAFTWTLGKSFDTHGPCGPWMVTSDEIDDPHALELRLLVNGKMHQKASTGLMIYNVFQQIEYLTTVMTLEPGDLLATGTPAGVGLAMDPPFWLKVGDVVRAEIDGIGHIENRVIHEPA